MISYKKVALRTTEMDQFDTQEISELKLAEITTPKLHRKATKLEENCIKIVSKSNQNNIKTAPGPKLKIS